MLRDMSYIDAVATALIRESPLAAVSAIPLRPQIPMAPMRSRSTFGSSPTQSTAALKSSVKNSAEATLRTAPPLSPVNEGSKASVTKPRSASVWA